ncbi:MAG: CHASE4 domain-containing protein [Synergistaceae bacterium]|nr:CHASE4 domain-containing protein [Synergistaceae bacterium]
MTLRKKTRLILGITMLVLLLLLDIVFTSLLRKSAEVSDRDSMELNLSKAIVSINGEAEALGAIASNWAYSDFTWMFMQGKAPTYPTKVLNRDALTRIGISSMIFIGNDKQVKLFKDYSPAEMPSTPQSEFSIISSRKNGMETLFNMTGIDGNSGIALRGKDPILFSAKPILDSNMEGPSAGYLIVTKALNEASVQAISRNLGFSFVIKPLTDEEINATDLPYSVIDEPDSKNTSITGRMLVRDTAGTPSFWVLGTAQRTNIMNAEKHLQFLFIALAALSILLCCLFDQIMKATFFNRMTRLQKEVESVRDESAPKDASVTVDGCDELTSLQRTLGDVLAYKDFANEKDKALDKISVMVYERFAQAGNRLCIKTLEDIAVAFTPGDEKFRKCIVRAAEMTARMCARIGIKDDDVRYFYLGALFNRIGLIGIPFSIRQHIGNLDKNELREYQKYPIISRDLLQAVELMGPAIRIPYCWNENWDGSGFPLKLTGDEIPRAARIYAIVDAWNEMTRPWPGRKIPSLDEIEMRLREQSGSRFDPQFVEEFIKLLREDAAAEKNRA